MNFVYPQFLFALLAISIPVIIHLFNFRRFKKVYFSDIRFLKDVKIQTQNRNKLKHLLILLSRILAVSFLVFAFAQPFIPSTDKKFNAGTKAISVYVDNSYSMENVSKNGILIDEAKKIAHEIALAHSQSDLFQLLTNNFEGKHQRLVNREEFLTMLDEVHVSPSVKLLSEVTKRQNDILSKSELNDKKVYLISDFQKTVSDFENIQQDTLISTTLLPIDANQFNNLFIDSCWFTSPVHQIDQNQILFVRIKNVSENTLENIPIKLFLNDQLKAPYSFNMLPNETKEIQLSFIVKESGIQQGKIEITDYPVTYDDKFYFSFNIQKHISVTCITSEPLTLANSTSPFTAASLDSPKKYLQSLYGKDSLFIFTINNENNINYASIAEQQVIILSELKVISSGLSQELIRYVQNGGSLVVFPATEIDSTSYRSLLSTLEIKHFTRIDTTNSNVSWVNKESEIFKEVFENTASTKKNENVDLPLTLSHWSFSGAQKTSEEVLLKLTNGESFFSKWKYKKGSVFTSAVSLKNSWSNLSRHAIFVPLMYNIALHSQPDVTLYYTIGRNVAINASTKKTGESIFKIKKEKSSANTNDNFEIIPETKVIDMEHKIFVHDQIQSAGNYQLFSDSEYISGISFNYDRKESNLSRFTLNEITALCKNPQLSSFSVLEISNKNISQALANIGQGKQLWKWCILMVLLFFAAEILLLRFWK